MAGYRVLAELGAGRRLARITEGPHAGCEVVLVTGSAPNLPRLDVLLGEAEEPPFEAAAPRSSPSPRAQALLCSLLTPEQTDDWVYRRRFSVATPYGTVELGRLFDLGFWPTAGGELRLCVVPTGATHLPEPDIWANLLLALRSDPDWFFTVANWRRPDGHWNFGPVPGIRPPSDPAPNWCSGPPPAPRPPPVADRQRW